MWFWLTRTRDIAVKWAWKNHRMETLPSYLQRQRALILNWLFTVSLLMWFLLCSVVCLYDTNPVRSPNVCKSCNYPSSRFCYCVRDQVVFQCLFRVHLTTSSCQVILRGCIILKIFAKKLVTHLWPCQLHHAITGFLLDSSLNLQKNWLLVAVLDHH